MSLQVLVLLVTLQLSFSMPDPNPNVNVNVDIHVEDNGCCDEGHSCVFGDTVYPNGDLVEGTCMQLKCINGAWNYIGKIQPECGSCTVYGDPHIIPFDNHTWPEGGQPVVIDDGTYTITQYPGIGNNPEFGVNSTFIDCTTSQASCILSATYYEPGIEVTMTLPGADNNCYGGNDPQCVIQVSVNGQNRSIGNSVESFYGTDGTVLVFQHNHITSVKDLNCTNIVGSKGFSMSLCVYAWDYAYFYVWALSSLKDELNGLCDTYTGTTRDVYIKRDGAAVTEPSSPSNYQVAIDEWADTWVVESGDNPVKRSASAVEEYHHNRVKREDNNVGRCKTAAVLIEITKQCLDLTEDVCKHTSPWFCIGINAACVFDLCRVPNPDHYALGYANHMQIHTQLQSSGTCNCDYHPGGCRINGPAPSLSACQCNYKGFFTCSGTVVGCMTPLSFYCWKPDNSKSSCYLGGGDCGGY